MVSPAVTSAGPNHVHAAETVRRWLSRIGNGESGATATQLGGAGTPTPSGIDRIGRVRAASTRPITAGRGPRALGPVNGSSRGRKRTKVRRWAAVGLAVSLVAGGARAVLPDEQLADPGLEARARTIGASLRCVVCQNQTIDDSDADLARDLRLIIRERLAAGDTDKAVIGFVEQRYGTFVLLKPPLDRETWPLWLGPAAILLLGSAGVGLYWRRRSLAA